MAAPPNKKHQNFHYKKEVVKQLAEDAGVSLNQAKVYLRNFCKFGPQASPLGNVASNLHNVSVFDETPDIDSAAPSRPEMTPSMESAGPSKPEVDRGPIRNAFDVMLNTTEYMVLVLRFPNRDRNQPYNEASGMKPLEIRFKPKCGLLQIDVPLDVDRNYNRVKGVEYGEAMKNSKLLQKGGDYGLAGGFTGRLGGASRAVKVDEDDETVAHDYFPGYGPEGKEETSEDSESDKDSAGDKGSKSSKGSEESEDEEDAEEDENGNVDEISETSKDSRDSEDSQGTKDDEVSIDDEVSEEGQEDEDGEDEAVEEDDEADEDSEDDKSSEEYDEEAELKNFEYAVSQGNVMNKITLEGTLEYPEDDDPIMMVGVFQGEIMHLTQVTASVWLQPVFPHLDAMDDNNKPPRRAKRASTSKYTPPQDSEAQAVNMTFASADSDEEELGPNAGSIAKLLKEIEEEPWTRLEWVDEDDPRAYDVYYNQMMLPKPVQAMRLRSAMTNREYMDSISAPRFDPTTRSVKTMSNKLPEDQSDTDSDEEEEGEENEDNEGDEGDNESDEGDEEGDEEGGDEENGKADGVNENGSEGMKG